MSNNRSRNTVLAAFGTVLIIIGTWLKINTPLVPITFQFFIVVLLSLVLGPRRASFSVLAYIVMGLIGLPVFAGGGGLHYFLSPSFGYIYGFYLAVVVSGILLWKEEMSIARQLAMSLLLTLIVYACGTAHLYLVQRFLHDEILTVKQLFAVSLFRTLAKDLVLNVFAVLLSRQIKAHLGEHFFRNLRKNSVYENEIKGVKR